MIVGVKMTFYLKNIIIVRVLKWKKITLEVKSKNDSKLDDTLM